MAAAFVPGTGNEVMIRRERDPNSRVVAHVYRVYVNGSAAYGPYWTPAEAYDRGNRLGVTAWPRLSEESSCNCSNPYCQV